MPKLVTDGAAAARTMPVARPNQRHHQPGKSLAANKPKALIQMATGSGKTFTSIGFIYRLIKFGGARRVLFLVDRGNLARQTKKEFDAYASPYNNYKFGEEYIVQHLQSNQLDTSRPRGHLHHPAHVQHAQRARAGRRGRRRIHRED
jgi:type I restriction enzyme R subunit